MRCVFSVAVILGCLSYSATADVPVPRFYDYWQRAPDGVGVMGVPTKSYRELFATRGPQQRFFDATDRDFYYAARGDTKALHRFLHSSDRDALGAPGEGWVADMVVLALVYGDDGLYRALQREPRTVREAVGAVIEQQMARDLKLFSRTRSLYRFRM